jgi:hypothetical protein
MSGDVPQSLEAKGNFLEFPNEGPEKKNSKLKEEPFPFGVIS